MRNYNFISKKEFEASLHYGCHYEGFVEDVGYVYWGQILGSSSHPNYPLNGIYAIPQGTTFVSDTTYVPIVIPEAVLIDSLEVSPTDILKAITRKNVDNSITVTLFNGKDVAVNPENSVIDIRIEEEYFEGKRAKVVTVTVEDRVTNTKEESKTLVKNALEIISNVSNYASLLGPLEYHMGEHMVRVHRHRAIETLDGYTVANKTGRYRYGPIRGEIAKPLASALKTGGAVLGVYGIGYTWYQYNEGEISKGKAWMDTVFGLVGFCGLPGMLLSLYYFAFISPDIDKPKARTMKKWDGTHAKDNTQVAVPDPLLGIPIPFKHQLPIAERPSFSPFGESPGIHKK